MITWFNRNETSNILPTRVLSVHWNTNISRAPLIDHQTQHTLNCFAVAWKDSSTIPDSFSREAGTRGCGELGRSSNRKQPKILRNWEPYEKNKFEQLVNRFCLETLSEFFGIDLTLLWLPWLVLQYILTMLIQGKSQGSLLSKRLERSLWEDQIRKQSVEDEVQRISTRS